MTAKTCALCGVNTNLQKSHFIPKSVYKYLERLKESSSQIMHATNKNTMFPSGKQITRHYFCASCEDLFNKNGEKFFAENAIPKVCQDNPPYIIDKLTSFIIVDCNKRRNNIRYEDNIFSESEKNKLLYFSVSIFWRATLEWTNVDKCAFPPEVEKEFKDFLLGKIDKITKSRVYFDLATEEIYSASFPTKLSENKYIFNIAHYIFTLKIENHNGNNSIRFGRNIFVTDLLLSIQKQRYENSEKKENLKS